MQEASVVLGLEDLAMQEEVLLRESISEELEGQNRSGWGGRIEYSAHPGRILRVEGRPVRR
jgi:hypothetical protein